MKGMENEAIMNHMVIVDIETTGFDPQIHCITEIGALKVRDGQVVERFSQLINPGVPIPKEIVELTGISDALVADMPPIEAVMPRFVDFCEDLPLLGHNILFDYGFLKTKARNQKLSFEKWGVDTLMIARHFLPGLKSRSLTALCEYFNIERAAAHRAYEDAAATYKLFTILWESYYSEAQAPVFRSKPLTFKPVKTEPITPKQIKYLTDLAVKHQVELNRSIESYTKSEASKEIDGIINRFGR